MRRLVSMLVIFLAMLPGIADASQVQPSNLTSGSGHERSACGYDSSTHLSAPRGVTLSSASCAGETSPTSAAPIAEQPRPLAAQRFAAEGGNRVFWSGVGAKDAAMSFARGNGAKTLEAPRRATRSASWGEPTFSTWMSKDS